MLELSKDDPKMIRHSTKKTLQHDPNKNDQQKTFKTLKQNVTKIQKISCFMVQVADAPQPRGQKVLARRRARLRELSAAERLTEVAKQLKGRGFVPRQRSLMVEPEQFRFLKTGIIWDSNFGHCVHFAIVYCWITGFSLNFSLNTFFLMWTLNKTDTAFAPRPARRLAMCGTNIIQAAGPLASPYHRILVDGSKWNDRVTNWLQKTMLLQMNYQWIWLCLHVLYMEFL